MLRFTFALAMLATGATGATGALANPSDWQSAWPRTDFASTTIEDWTEIRSGGPPKDGIPSITGPSFVAVGDKPGLDDREPVMTLKLPGESPRAYPIRYLMWHEIVNDTVGDIPVAVTFCPLCNSGMVFDRRVDGDEREFGVTGKLRHSDMIMYDRETESWWQQATGTGIVGAHAGDGLTDLPAWMESWSAFRSRNPDGRVMAEPEWRRSYGQNPYTGYDSSQRPFLYDGADPPHGIAPLARVVRVGDQAWPLTRLAAEGRIDQAGLTLDWSAGTASALDTRRIGEGRDVGSVRVRDSAGHDVPHDVMFAFAFDAFWPDGTWMLE
jgi:hypothetical protein